MKHLFEIDGQLYGFGDLTLANYDSDHKGIYLESVRGGHKVTYRDELASTIWDATKAYAAENDDLLQVDGQGVIIRVSAVNHVQMSDIRNPSSGMQGDDYRLLINGVHIFRGNDTKAVALYKALRAVAQGG